MNARQFLVTITGDEDTRWQCDDLYIAERLAFQAQLVSSHCTTGHTPEVEVKLQPTKRKPKTKLSLV